MMNIKKLSILGMLALMLATSTNQSAYAEDHKSELMHELDSEDRGHNHGAKHKHGDHKKHHEKRRKKFEERMKSFPPAAQEELKANKEKIKDMSREERREYMKEFYEKHGIERPKRKHGGKWDKRREEIREQLKDLPPEERKAKMKEYKEKFKGEHKEHMKERWDDATPEQRAKFCEKAKKRCDKKGRPMACEMVKTKCNSL